MATTTEFVTLGVINIQSLTRWLVSIFITSVIRDAVFAEKNLLEFW